jgi:hypothetical protein
MKDFEFYVCMAISLIAILFGLSYLVYQLTLAVSQINIIVIPF